LRRPLRRRQWRYRFLQGDAEYAPGSGGQVHARQVRDWMSATRHRVAQRLAGASSRSAHSSCRNGRTVNADADDIYIRHELLLRSRSECEGHDFGPAVRLPHECAKLDGMRCAPALAHTRSVSARAALAALRVPMRMARNGSGLCNRLAACGARSYKSTHGRVGSMERGTVSVRSSHRPQRCRATFRRSSRNGFP